VVADHVDDRVVPIHAAREVLGRVVDHLVRSEGTDELDVARAADARDVRALRLCDLNRVRPDAARSAIHEHAPARTAAERLQRRHPCAGERRRLLEVDRRRLRDEMPLLAARVLGERRARRADHRVAGREFRHGAADHFDHARAVEPEAGVLRPPQPDERADDPRRAAHHVPVVRVDRRGVDADEDVVLADLRTRNLADLQPLRRAVLLVANRLHHVYRVNNMFTT
jgi:hypothetical protein